MWKQWINVLLGLLIVFAAYAEASFGWLVAGGALVTILAFWSAVEQGAEGTRTIHAH